MHRVCLELIPRSGAISSHNYYVTSLWPCHILHWRSDIGSSLKVQQTPIKLFSAFLITSLNLIPVLASTDVSQDVLGFPTLLVPCVLPNMWSLLFCHLSFLIHDLVTGSAYAVSGVLFHSLIAAL